MVRSVAVAVDLAATALNLNPKTGSNGNFNNSIIVVGRSSEITLCIVGNSTKWKIIHLRIVYGIPISISLISSHTFHTEQMILHEVLSLMA